MTVTPCDDIAAIWPDLAAETSPRTRSVRAVSTGGLRGGFDYLRFSGSSPAVTFHSQTQESISSGYASRYPDVVQQQGWRCPRSRHT